MIAHCCTNNDYGKHQISINSEPAGEFDFYGDKLDWRTIDLGQHSVHKGANTIEVTALTPNTKAAPHNMFGLDYILLKA